MINGKSILAIIPARSGSKGLPDKNIKLLNGIPLLAHTVTAALKSEIFDEVLLSTDSRKYADIGIEYGASVPFLRSKKNSADISSSWSVVSEVLSKHSKKFDVVTLLQPTSPLRTSKNIVEAMHLFLKKRADAVVSVGRFRHSLKWINTLPKDLSLKGFVDKKYINIPRQKIEEYYSLNGAIYIVKSELVCGNLDLFSINSYAYIMSPTESVDIDDELDFEMAEFILKNNRK